MSDIHDFNPSEQKARVRVCRVAYTLNNSQPVRSTIIGDQPLFYIDADTHLDDEDDNLLFGASDVAVLENEIEILKKEMQSFERLAVEYAQEPDRSYQDFLEDKIFVAKIFETAPAETTDALVEILGRSRLAKAYLECAEHHGVRLQYSYQADDAFYERKSGLILINPLAGTADRVLLATRELRRHWQHRQGALLNPLLFHPDNAVLINRVQSADLIASMIRIAWELQLCGERGAWERIENSSLSDLGRAFAREAFLDFRTINNGQACASVMESWFLSERCRHEDKKLIKQMLADYKGYVFDKEEAQKAITPALISALGSMPYGKNYLAAHTNTILTDPVFTDVRDRSNANFLWFIKFERSFRETERELQSSAEPTVRGIRSPGKTPPQDSNYENATAEIIRIFPEQPGPGRSPQKAGDKSHKDGKILSPKSSVRRTKNKTADIVYLRRWSGEKQ
jgi:hypothetical protein